MILSNFTYNDKSSLIDQIDQYATKDQDKTSIRLNRAYCRIYQPYHGGNGVERKHDFESLRKELVPIVQDMLGDEYWISRDIWGLTYAEGESTAPHAHQGASYSAILYLLADDGCGTLNFDNEEIEPQEDMLVVFCAHRTHWVLPNIVAGARRVCVAMNIHRLCDLKTHDNHRGYFTPDEPI